jgi:hypothetical protein
LKKRLWGWVYSWNFAIDTYPIKEDSDKEELGVDYLKKLMQKCLILTYYT